MSMAIQNKLLIRLHHHQPSGEKRIGALEVHASKAFRQIPPLVIGVDLAIRVAIAVGTELRLDHFGTQVYDAQFPPMPP